MQLYIDIFLAFFIPNIVGYGGGPAIIPLIEAQVVGQYGWMNASQFAEVLALGNALPSPIATKITDARINSVDISYPIYFNII